MSYGGYCYIMPSENTIIVIPFSALFPCKHDRGKLLFVQRIMYEHSLHAYVPYPVENLQQK